MTSRFSVVVVIDLVVVSIAFLIGIASSGVIAGGLAVTCEAFRKAADNDDDIP